MINLDAAKKLAADWHAAMDEMRTASAASVDARAHARRLEERLLEAEARCRVAMKAWDAAFAVLDEPSTVVTTGARFPHCDSKVLHRTGCKYCDDFPKLKQRRIEFGVSFTGEPEEGKLPCPSEIFRPLATIERWPGNRRAGEEE